MSILIRPMSPDDAWAFLEVHHRSVREIAAKDYPPAIIEAWARLLITEDAVKCLQANPDNEVRFVAEIDGRIVGIGALVVAKSELRACYVAPEATRKGVGSALVREIEHTASAHGLTFLALDSSLTAELFYTRLGYRVLDYGQHILNSGEAMACVKMRKELACQAPADDA